MKITRTHFVVLAVVSSLLVPLVDASEGRAARGLSPDDYNALPHAMAGLCRVNREQVAGVETVPEVTFANVANTWLGTISHLIEACPAEDGLSSIDDLEGCAGNFTAAKDYLDHAATLAKECPALDGCDLTLLKTFEEEISSILHQLKFKALKVALKGVIQHLGSLSVQDIDTSNLGDDETVAHFDSLVSTACAASHPLEQLYGLAKGYTLDMPLEVQDDLKRAQTAVNDAFRWIKRCSAMLSMLGEKAANEGFPKNLYERVLKMMQELKGTVGLTRDFLADLKTAMGHQHDEVVVEEQVKIGDNFEVQLYNRSLWWGSKSLTIHGIIRKQCQIEGVDDANTIKTIKEKYNRLLEELIEQLNSSEDDLQSLWLANSYLDRLAQVKREIVKVLCSLDNCKSKALSVFRETVEDDFYSCQLLAAVKAVDYLLRCQTIVPEAREKEFFESFKHYLEDLRWMLSDSSHHLNVFKRLAALSGLKDTMYQMTLPRHFAECLSIVLEKIAKHQMAIGRLMDTVRSVKDQVWVEELQEAIVEAIVSSEPSPQPFTTEMHVVEEVMEGLKELQEALRIVHNIAASLRVEANQSPADDRALYKSLECPQYDIPNLEDALEAICVPVPRQSALEVFRMAREKHWPGYVAEYDGDQLLSEMQSKKTRLEGLLRKTGSCAEDNPTVSEFRRELEGELRRIRKDAFDQLMDRLSPDAPGGIESVPDMEKMSLKKRFDTLDGSIALAHSIVRIIEAFASLAGISPGAVEPFDGFAEEEHRKAYSEVQNHIDSLLESAESFSTAMSRFKTDNSGFSSWFIGVSSEDCKRLEDKVAEYQKILKCLKDELGNRFKAWEESVVQEEDAVENIDKTSPSEKNDELTRREKEDIGNVSSANKADKRPVCEVSENLEMNLEDFQPENLEKIQELHQITAEYCSQAWDVVDTPIDSCLGALEECIKRITDISKNLEDALSLAKQVSPHTKGEAATVDEEAILAAQKATRGKAIEVAVKGITRVLNLGLTDKWSIEVVGNDLILERFDKFFPEASVLVSDLDKLCRLGGDFKGEITSKLGQDDIDALYKAIRGFHAVINYAKANKKRLDQKRDEEFPPEKHKQACTRVQLLQNAWKQVAEFSENFGSLKQQQEATTDGKVELGEPLGNKEGWENPADKRVKTEEPSTESDDNEFADHYESLMSPRQPKKGSDPFGTTFRTSVKEPYRSVSGVFGPTPEKDSKTPSSPPGGSSRRQRVARLWPIFLPPLQETRSTGPAGENVETRTTVELSDDEMKLENFFKEPPGHKQVSSPAGVISSTKGRLLICAVVFAFVILGRELYLVCSRVRA